jgi:hypothetical protein
MCRRAGRRGAGPGADDRGRRLLPEHARTGADRPRGEPPTRRAGRRGQAGVQGRRRGRRGLAGAHRQADPRRRHRDGLRGVLRARPPRRGEPRGGPGRPRRDRRQDGGRAQPDRLQEQRRGHDPLQGPVPVPRSQRTARPRLPPGAARQPDQGPARARCRVPLERRGPRQAERVRGGAGRHVHLRDPGEPDVARARDAAPGRAGRPLQRLLPRRRPGLPAPAHRHVAERAALVGSRAQAAARGAAVRGRSSRRT